jgi:hypothetical protein
MKLEFIDLVVMVLGLLIGVVIGMRTRVIKLIKLLIGK